MVKPKLLLYYKLIKCTMYETIQGMIVVEYD